VSDYPTQPRRQPGGWPSQPPQHTPGPESGYGPLVRPRRGRRRGRGPVVLLTSLVVLVVLAVIADFVAKAYAQSRIASQVQQSAKMTGKPSVNIEGFPFLTQVAGHNLKAIDISASNVPAGKFTITAISARATGVHPNSSFNGATIDHITGSALISFTSLENALGLAGIATISADPANGPNAVKVDADVIGSVTGKIELTGPNTLTLQLGSLSGLASLLGGAVPLQTQTITIPKLPAGLTVKSVTVTSQGIVATAAADHTTLTQ
jgi:hypothetical protein